MKVSKIKKFKILYKLYNFNLKNQYKYLNLYINIFSK